MRREPFKAILVQAQRVVLGLIGLLINTQGYAMSPDQSRIKEKEARKTEVWEPVPPVVEAPSNTPPSDAVVLLGGDDLAQWEAKNGRPAQWDVHDGILTVKPGTGDIRTKRRFCDIQLHLEWRAPEPEESMEGQQRNNSGVFLQERYEVQVLDSYRNKTYANGQAASVYKQHIPLVNATRPPGVWQTYDVIFSAPLFNDAGKLVKPGYITVLHNGVLVQNHAEIQGPTAWTGTPEYEAHGCAPIALQDHGDRVSFRNIWVREL